MFDKTYQGGDHFEVLTTQGSNPLQSWKVASHVQRVYDKSVRGYTYQTGGTEDTGLAASQCSLQLPKDAELKRGHYLGLTQPYICFQLFFPTVEGGDGGAAGGFGEEESPTVGGSGAKVGAKKV